MPTSELQREAYGEVSTVELMHAEEAVRLPCPAEEAVRLPCPAEEAVPLSSPAEEAAQPSSAARGGTQCPRATRGSAQHPRSSAQYPRGSAQLPSAAGGGALTFNPGGGAAPLLCCLPEAASLSVAARDRSHRGPGPPLEGGSWCSGRSTLWRGVLLHHGQQRALWHGSGLVT
ncbi:skin secretory protein xP2 isoform X2 [Ictalurus punctatus]|uniref:Skin secretory protein xP2 isoform X2 n=1 Tax=Ictalurus punctatus TaxID=7998 RepID=A0A9F7RRI5_ICTPU|nr:skin secretory protein xP2 isoform X2 [Ictalurus punctatus]